MSDSLWPHGLWPTGLPCHGVLQARILEWVAKYSLTGSSRPRDRTQVSCIAGRFFTVWVTRETHILVFIAKVLPHLCPMQICNFTFVNDGYLTVSSTKLQALWGQSPCLFMSHWIASTWHSIRHTVGATKCCSERINGITQRLLHMFQRTIALLGFPVLLVCCLVFLSPAPTPCSYWKSVRFSGGMKSRLCCSPLFKPKVCPSNKSVQFMQCISTGYFLTWAAP